MDLLSRIEQDIKAEFERTNRILTFDEYMEHVRANPRMHTRGSAQYVVDMMDHFGHVETREGETHFKLFDMEFAENTNAPLADGGRTGSRHRVIAQNDVQHKIYRSLQNFVKEGI